MGEPRERTVVKLVPFMALIVVGIVLLVFASFTVGVADGDFHFVFVTELGVPGILAIVLGILGIFFLRIMR